MTPHSATRKTRSQSPPQLTQRRPVSQMHAAMPSSSITPYMWSVSGPEAEGAVRRRRDVAEDEAGHERHCARAARRPSRSTEDADGELGRTAALDELDRLVEVDLVRAASATASSPAKPTRMSSAVRQRSTRSTSVSMISCAAVFIRSLRSHFRESGPNGSPPPGGFRGTIGPGSPENSSTEPRQRPGGAERRRRSPAAGRRGTRGRAPGASARAR